MEATDVPTEKLFATLEFVQEELVVGFHPHEEGDVKRKGEVYGRAESWNFRLAGNLKATGFYRVRADKKIEFVLVYPSGSIRSFLASVRPKDGIDIATLNQVWLTLYGPCLSGCLQ